MKKRILALALSFAMVFGLVACGGGAEETKAPADTTAETEAAGDAAEEEITLNVAYMPNYGSLWAVTTAMEKGYFAEEGITVNLTSFQDGPTIIAAMESGSIDIGYIGQGAHKLCIQGNAKIFALSHISNGDAVIGGPEVKTLEDLKGKKVAYSSGTSSEDILKNALTKAGLTMDDIEAVEMEAANIVTAMLSGGVDACATWSPNSLKIMEEGEDLTLLCDNKTFIDTTVSLASWIVTPSYADENADKILKFTKALYKAMDYAADANYEEVAEFVANVTKTDYDSVYAQRGDADWLTGAEVAAGVEDGTVAAYYQLQQDNFIAAEAVTEAVPLENYIMFDNMTEAAK